MDAVRYIHAADLHLDAPFQGLSREVADEGRLSRLLQEASALALERLFRLCEAEQPDFLLLAGDIYNQEEHSVKAQLQLRDGCERLNRMGIRVFIAHGNHDPLSSRLTALEWPDNVTIFGESPESYTVDRNGTPIAIVHGISHVRQRESRNLAKLFARAPQPDLFQIGVLHTTVEGEHKQDRYAPCALQDLLDTQLDAWALGHIHEQKVLYRLPFIAYSGNIQGRHINEEGPKGCLCVTARRSGTAWHCTENFVPLSPVQWCTQEISLDDINHLDAIERQFLQTLETSGKNVSSECDAVMVRIRCTGRTSLDTLLRDPQTQQDLAERTLHLSSATPKIWLKDVDIATLPPIDHKEYQHREDLLGETMRLVDRLSHDNAALQAMTNEAFEPLFSHPRLRRVLNPLTEEERSRLLEEAERLCIDLLESR